MAQRPRGGGRDLRAAAPRVAQLARGGRAHAGDVEITVVCNHVGVLDDVVGMACPRGAKRPRIFEREGMAADPVMR